MKTIYPSTEKKRRLIHNIIVELNEFLSSSYLKVVLEMISVVLRALLKILKLYSGRDNLSYISYQLKNTAPYKRM